jgi:hypothetical protein
MMSEIEGNRSEESTEGESTGLPVLRSWAKVYCVVAAIFVLWVGLLIMLKRTFS